MEDLTKVNAGALITGDNEILGFEDSRSEDIIIPRVKVVQTLSPEKKEKVAEEGDIVNSLTKDKLDGKKFIPVFMFYSNIKWKPRAEGGGIACQAKDGRIATGPDGKIVCKDCGECEFDNSKTGKDSQPLCTKYINFFGFMEGELMPIVLSFAKTNYAEGRKLLSLAKSMMSNMWAYSYTLANKLQSKNGNEWYILTTTQAAKTSEDNQAHARNLYNYYKNRDMKIDLENSVNATDELADQGPSDAY